MLFYYLTEKVIDLNSELFKDTNNHELYLYIDLQNTCRALFLQDIMQQSYQYMLETKQLDLSPFSSILNYVINTRIRLKKYKFKKIKFIFFLDKGSSSYHTLFNKDYKLNRHISSWVIDKKMEDLFHSNLKINWELCNKWLNTFEDIYFIYFKYLETDFVPYYIINKHFLNRDDIYHVILSSDKDMFQIMDRDKIYQYLKINKQEYIINKNTTILKLLNADKNAKVEQQIYKNNWWKYNNAIDLILAFGGDTGDDVKGLPRCGYLTALKMLDCFTEKLNISINELRKLIMTKTKIEYKEHKSDILKYVKLFNDNIDDLFIYFHLVSFRALVHWLEVCSNSSDDVFKLLKKCDKYKLNKELKSRYLDPLNNLFIDNNHKLKYNKEQFITSLKHIKGGVCFNNCNINMKTIDYYFQLFGEI